jgi:hypothetical protein
LPFLPFPIFIVISTRAHFPASLNNSSRQAIKKS